MEKTFAFLDMKLTWIGYATFFPKVKDYDLGGSPASWARVPAARHTMTNFPFSTYIWFLDQNSLIMNPDLTIEDHIMDKKRIESLMIKDQPIVPPDSVIKTWPHLKGENVELVLTQDKEGLAQGSFIVKRGDWSKFFLDTWFDPLYRSYNFQRADTHALVSPIYFPALAHTDFITGAHCPMASNDPLETRPHPSTNHERIRKRPLQRGIWSI